MKRVYFTLLLMVIFSVSAFAGQLYIVKPHDTLWSISKRFYKNPFLWGKLWKNNTYINDPNLIFPGEVLKVGKFGLEIYEKPIKQAKVNQKHKPKGEKHKYLSAVWYDGYKFYSSCGRGYCVWNKHDFKIATITYDTYSHIEVSPKATVYLHTTRKTLPKKLYVYRPKKDLLDTSLCSKEFEVYMPIGELEVVKKIKPDIFEARLVRSAGEISQADIVSTAYPYEVVDKLVPVKLGNVRVKQIITAQSELQSGLGFMFFFKADKNLPVIAGRLVTLARLNKGSAIPIDIGNGVVISQYKQFIGIYFPSINGLSEIPDRTQQYVLR